MGYSVPREQFAGAIDAGHVWYWVAEGEVVATVTLDLRRPSYYPARVWEDAIPAWYVCRLAVSRLAGGREVGSHVLAEIEEAATHSGVRVLRLDVTASNPFLESYYSARGFSRVAEDDVMGERAVFMEKTTHLRVND